MLKIDHIAMTATNIEETAKWYIENLNFEIKYIDQTWALLINQNGTKIALAKPEQHPPHVAFTVSNLNSFPPGKIKYHRDGSAYLYTEDPSGNVIEYICWPDSFD